MTHFIGYWLCSHASAVALGEAICRLIHNFGPERNISANIGIMVLWQPSPFLLQGWLFVFVLQMPSRCCWLSFIGNTWARCSQYKRAPLLFHERERKGKLCLMLPILVFVFSFYHTKLFSLLYHSCIGYTPKLLTNWLPHVICGCLC